MYGINRRCRSTQIISVGHIKQPRNLRIAKKTTRV